MDETYAIKGSDMLKGSPERDVVQRGPALEMLVRRVSNGFVITFSDGSSRYTHPTDSMHVAVTAEAVASLAQQWAVAASMPTPVMAKA